MNRRISLQRHPAAKTQPEILQAGFGALAKAVTDLSGSIPRAWFLPTQSLTRSCSFAPFLLEFSDAGLCKDLGFALKLDRRLTSPTPN